MIFVTVGSSGRFEALIRHMDELSLKLDEPVIIQTGKSDYTPKHSSHFAFEKDLTPYYQQADLVVTHGGAGTCFEVLRMGKKLVGVENKDVNDAHQWDLLQRLETEGYIIWCRNIDDLETAIRQAKEREFKPYVSPPCDIPKIIEDFMGKG